MKYIVIGNGFDLAHNLNTKYVHFKAFLLREGSAEGRKKVDTLNRYIDEDLLWSEYEYALGTLDAEGVKEYNSCELKSYSEEPWSDDYHHSYQRAISEELEIIANNSEDFRKWIKSIDVSFALPRERMRSLFTGDYMILSFNYTNTLEQLYSIPSDRIKHIHGYAYSDEVLIVGHHDDVARKKYEKNYDENVDDMWSYLDTRQVEADEIIDKYFKNTYKNTKKTIEQNEPYWKSLKDISDVYVIGHSLSDIDFDYFSVIKTKTNSDCKWFFSYQSGFKSEAEKRVDSFANKLGIDTPCCRLITI